VLVTRLTLSNERLTRTFSHNYMSDDNQLCANVRNLMLKGIYNSNM